jgi:type IV secretion system protein VirD4
MAAPTATDAGWSVGRSRSQGVYVSIEDSVVLIGPPRSGKGFRVLTSAILDWSGPLITTSTRNDNLLSTYARRKERGEVTVFDPQQLAGVRSSLRISPIAGCEDALTADQRAQSIISGTALGTSTSNQEWAGAASSVFAQLLHAAAVSGADVSSLYRWGSNPAAALEAANILDSDGADGWGDSLRAVLEGDAKMLSSTWFGVAAAVRPLAIPEIQQALRPAPGEAFDADRFLAGENTLYLIGTGAGAGSMGGFLGAVLDDVVSRARRKANASPSARLEPPLGLILDEIANMFYWRQLPTVMADGGGIGISTLVVLQALSQAETAWSRAEMDTIWSAATAKLILGGASDVSQLRDLAALMGERDVRKRSYSYNAQGGSSSEQTDRSALMSIDEIRRMPETMGLLAYRNRRPVLLDLAGWTERSDARQISAGKRDTERDSRLVFAERLTPPTPAPDAVAGEEVGRE